MLIRQRPKSNIDNDQIVPPDRDRDRDLPAGSVPKAIHMAGGGWLADVALARPDKESLLEV